MTQTDTSIETPIRHDFVRSGDAADARPDTGINVGQSERLISGTAGAMLALAGLSRRSIPGLLMMGLGGALLHRAITGHCHGYAALGIDTAHDDADGAAPEEYFDHGIHVQEVFTINKPAEELYAFWRKLENLPRIFGHIESVTELDAKRSHWVANGPLGMKYEWYAEIINEEPGELIAWRSLAGADVDNAGSVRFVQAPGDRGTELKVTIDYIPTAGVVGKALATMIGQNPESQLREDLRRFKQFMASGEVPTTGGQLQ